MRHTAKGSCWHVPVVLTLLVSGICSGTASGAVTLLGTQYQQDNPYSEYRCVYHYGNYPTNCGTELVGSNAMVFVKNTGTSSVTINDVTVAGYNLDTILARNAELHDSASIWYYWDNPPSDIVNAGEPVWYRADPNPIPAGGTARVAVRLRWIPTTSTISVGVVTSAGTVNTTVTKDATAPQLASVGFSPDRTKVYLHWRRAGGAAPTTIYMDGVDVTSSATTVGDPNTNYAATTLTFGTALTNMSYHTYQGVYSDGKTATGALRTWINPYVYGTWAAHALADGDTAGAMAWIDGCEDRGVNSLIMNNGSGGLADFLGTSEGRNYADAHGYGYVKDDNAWGTNPQMWFIDDEPDIEEGNVTCGTGMRIPCGGAYNQGVLGMRFLERGEVLRGYNSSRPTTINIDGNFKPEGWYAYGQLVDVLMVDSYYEQEQAGNHWYHPERDVLYTKPTSIYAATIASATAAEPNPLHMILYACEYKDMDLDLVWPFPSPQSKQIQAFYALAGGAKGMAYWWYKPGYPFNGLDDGGPEAVALWKHIGVIGNYIKAAQPLLVRSHPVSATINASPYVWAKTLAVGTDAMILIAVTDNFYNDETGYHATAVTNANVTLTLPSWLQNSPTAFEITPNGTSTVGVSLNGSQLVVPLGNLGVSRMVVITTNSSLKSDIESHYLTNCRPGICAIASEYCTAQNTTPTITLQPGSITVQAENPAYFTVLAAGTGTITYQWQKNSVNITNGTGVTGTTTPSLILTDIDSNDAASYRCVVTNSYGSVNSSAATLTVTPPICGTMTNTSFEGGNTSGVATGWTAYQRATNPTTVYSIQTASPPAGAGSQYQQILNTSSTGGAGVRQDITGCVAGLQYTVTGWMRTNSGSATCTVKASPTASTNWATAVDLSPAQYTSSSSWVAFSGTVTATSSTMTIWLDGHTGGTGNNNAACFDNVQVTCWPPQAPTITQQPTAQSVCSGANANFTVAATGTGTLTYQWQKNQVNVTNGGHYSGCTTTTLTVTGATSADAANYRCLITDSAGSIYSNEAALTIKAATTITGQPAAQNVCSGANASFTVTATGDGTLTYQWQKNSVNVTNGGHYSGCTTATLTVTGATSADAASYRCVATGGCGSATSSTAALTIKAATTITAHPSNQTLDPGQNATFSVTATGDGTLTYQWQKNAANLSDGNGITGATTNSLQIAGVEEGDEGSYRCIVTGGCGSATSNAATLTVNSCPTGSLTNGDFEGTNTGGVGAGWTAYNRATAPTTVYSIQTASPPTGGGLQYQQILNTSATGGAGVRQDIGGCIVGNVYTVAGWMRTNSASATCTVKCSPTASTSWATAANLSPAQTTNSSTWVAFSGTVTATGTSMTIWLDGQTGGTGLNKAACFDSVTVTGCFSAVTPYIVQQPSNVSVALGGTANFSVTAGGTPPLSYQWQKGTVNIVDGNGISGATTSALQITGIEVGDEGSYRCVVTNPYGSVNSNSATLTITCSTPSLLNPSFEGGNTSGVATSWTGYQRATNPSTVWTIQTATPPAGAGVQYQQIANTSATGGGGVRQNITGCVPGATYTIAGWMRTNSASATCTVKCSPTASTAWSTAANLTPAQTTTSSTWTAFSGTITATGTSMTVWLDGHTGGTGLNKAACFDGVTVTCTP